MTARTAKKNSSLAIAYYRVSTREQADSGLGLDAQRKDVEAFAAANDLTIVAEFTDAGLSGKLELCKRPALLAAVAAADELNAATLIVGKLCRLSRDELNSMLIERTLNRAGVELKSAAGEGTEQTGVHAQLLKGMIRLMAATEACVTAERTKKALAAKRARSAVDGTWAGGHPPKGFTVDSDGFLFPTPDLVDVLMAVQLRLDGLSIRKTAKELGISHTKVQRWTSYWVGRPEELLAYASACEAVS